MDENVIYVTKENKSKFRGLNFLLRSVKIETFQC